MHPNINSHLIPAVAQIPNTKKYGPVIAAMNDFDITKEKYSESASREVFGELAKIFIAQKLKFYADDFYYKFRNNLITNLGNHLLIPENLDYFLLGSKDKNDGSIQHKLNFSITYTSTEKRNYSSASYCDKWGGCDSESLLESRFLAHIIGLGS